MNFLKRLQTIIIICTFLNWELMAVAETTATDKIGATVQTGSSGIHTNPLATVNTPSCIGNYAVNPNRAFCDSMASSCRNERMNEIISLKNQYIQLIEGQGAITAGASSSVDSSLGGIANTQTGAYSSGVAVQNIYEERDGYNQYHHYIGVLSDLQRRQIPDAEAALTACQTCNGSEFYCSPPLCTSEQSRITELHRQESEAQANVNRYSAAGRANRAQQAGTQIQGAGDAILGASDNIISTMESADQAINDARTPLQQQKDQLDSLLLAKQRMNEDTFMLFDLAKNASLDIAKYDCSQLPSERRSACENLNTPAVYKGDLELMAISSAAVKYLRCQKHPKSSIEPEGHYLLHAASALHIISEVGERDAFAKGLNCNAQTGGNLTHQTDDLSSRDLDTQYKTITQAYNILDGLSSGLKNKLGISPTVIEIYGKAYSGALQELGERSARIMQRENDIVELDDKATDIWNLYLLLSAASLVAQAICDIGSSTCGPWGGCCPCLTECAPATALSVAAFIANIYYKSLVRKLESRINDLQRERFYAYLDCTVPPEFAEIKQQKQLKYVLNFSKDQSAVEDNFLVWIQDVTGQHFSSRPSRGVIQRTMRLVAEAARKSEQLLQNSIISNAEATVSVATSSSPPDIAYGLHIINSQTGYSQFLDRIKHYARVQSNYGRAGDHPTRWDRFHNKCFNQNTPNIENASGSDACPSGHIDMNTMMAGLTPPVPTSGSYPAPAEIPANLFDQANPDYGMMTPFQRAKYFKFLLDKYMHQFDLWKGVLGPEDQQVKALHDVIVQMDTNAMKDLTNTTPVINTSPPGTGANPAVCYEGPSFQLDPDCSCKLTGTCSQLSFGNFAGVNPDWANVARQSGGSYGNGGTSGGSSTTAGVTSGAFKKSAKDVYSSIEKRRGELVASITKKSGELVKSKKVVTYQEISQKGEARPSLESSINSSKKGSRSSGRAKDADANTALEANPEGVTGDLLNVNGKSGSVGVSGKSPENADEMAGKVKAKSLKDLIGDDEDLKESEGEGIDLASATAGLESASTNSGKGSSLSSGVDLVGNDESPIHKEDDPRTIFKIISKRYEKSGFRRLQLEK